MKDDAQYDFNLEEYGPRGAPNGVSGEGGGGKVDNKTNPALKKVDPKVTNTERNEAAHPRMRGIKGEVLE